MADLRENMNAEQESLRHLDLETFGEIMDDMIHKSRVGLLVTKEENSDAWQLHGAGYGAVLDFYILLNTLQPIFLQMLEELGRKADENEEMLAKALCQELEKDLIQAAKEKKQ